MIKRVILICLLIGLLLMTPISATVFTSKVDDKIFDKTYNTVCILHTVDFGDIRVSHEVYNQVMINDTVTFSNNTDFEFYYTVYRVNGNLIPKYT